jgi:DNA-binding LacI/PurR family transcriptional regulator
MARTRRATLADVAREAGVVAMTASRAINRTGYVSEEVRLRVLEAAEKLQYRPNVLARHLKGRRLNAVGVMLPDIANPFSSELIAGIKKVLDAAGYTAFLSVADRGVEQERTGLQAFVDHRVDGLIVATRGTNIGDRVIKELVQQGVPVVTIGRPMPRVNVDVIDANDYQGAFDLVTHLVERGHRHIGFIGIAPRDAHTLRRYEGYAAALAKAGLKLHEEYTVGPAKGPAFSTQQDGYEGMMTLARLKRRPTAVFARNDFTAMGALRAAHELGLRVPGDVAIAGFDDIPLAAYAAPPLTTVSQPIREQGELAAQILIDRIEGRSNGAFALHTMACQLVVRKSTAE